jgi:hypothetical protein
MVTRINRLPAGFVIPAQWSQRQDRRPDPIGFTRSNTTATESSCAGSSHRAALRALFRSGSTAPIARVGPASGSRCAIRPAPPSSESGARFSEATAPPHHSSTARSQRHPANRVNRHASLFEISVEYVSDPRRDPQQLTQCPRIFWRPSFG